MDIPGGITGYPGRSTRKTVSIIIMVSGWHLFNKDRKTAIRVTGFLLIVLVLSVIIGIFFLDINKRKPEKEKVEDSRLFTDSLK